MWAVALADRRHLAPLLLAPLAMTALTGCVSTQQRSAWSHLHAQRLLASRLAVRVPSQPSPVAVTSVSVLRSGPASIVVVALRNDAAHPVSDLPISVGTARRGHPGTYLNGAPGSAYFQTHAPALAAHADGVFMLPLPHALPPGRLFARVGARSATGLPPPRRLPRLNIGVMGGNPPRITVSNPTNVPQEQLEVYVWAAQGSRIVAAGAASLPSLDAGARASVAPPLLGDPSAGVLHVQSNPTIFD